MCAGEFVESYEEQESEWDCVLTCAGGVRVRVVMGRDGQVRGTDSQDPEAGRLLDQPGSVAVSLAGGEERCG